MFNLFKKNKPVVCNHKWKDFPWYMRIDERIKVPDEPWKDVRKIYVVEVYEPYVCVKCKKRRDEHLGGFESNDKSLRDKKAEEIKKKYADKIKGSIEIEDMILDEQLVDRRYLELLEELNNPSDKFAGLDLFTEIERMKKEIAATSAVAAKTGEDNEQHTCN